MNSIKRVLKLTTGELIIGDSEAIGDGVLVKEPYSIYETFDELGEQKVAVMPYEYPYLMEPMKDVTLRAFDIMWSKKLDEFPQVHQQYIAATSGVQLDTKEKIVL